MFDFSTPQNGHTIQVSCRMLPHSAQSSMPRIHPCNLGSPKKIRAPLKCKTITAHCAQETLIRLDSNSDYGFISNKHIRNEIVQH